MTLLPCEEDTSLWSVSVTFPSGNAETKLNMGRETSMSGDVDIHYPSMIREHRSGIRDQGTWITTCLFTRLESQAWSQQGFWQPSFCRKCNLLGLFYWGTSVVLLFIAFLEERECVEISFMMQNGLVFTFTFLHGINADKHHFISPIITKAS